jgi:hypothetical protein
MSDALDPSLLVDCRSTPRRPLTDPDLTHDWTPQHYPSGAIGGYYCPDCLIAGAPTSTLCPDRVGALVAEVRRLTGELEREAVEARALQSEEGSAATLAFDAIATACGCPHWDYPGQVVRDVLAVVKERDEARAALAAARIDGARGMRDSIAAILDDGGFDPWPAVKRTTNLAAWEEYRVTQLDAILDAVLVDAARDVRALDPATVGGGS